MCKAPVFNRRIFSVVLQEHLAGKITNILHETSSQNIPKRDSKSLSSKHCRSSRFISTYQTDMAVQSTKGLPDTSKQTGHPGLHRWHLPSQGHALGEFGLAEGRKCHELSCTKACHAICCHQSSNMPSKSVQAANITITSPWYHLDSSSRVSRRTDQRDCKRFYRSTCSCRGKLTTSDHMTQFVTAHKLRLHWSLSCRMKGVQRWWCHCRQSWIRLAEGDSMFFFVTQAGL